MNRAELGGLVAHLAYKPGWTFKLAGPLGRFLCVFARTPDSLNPSNERITQHQFEVPDDLPDARAFLRWTLERLLLVEQHEASEFFQISGHRPFFPHHQDEGSPYELVERWESTPWH
jgi:hypothetical protein